MKEPAEKTTPSQKPRKPLEPWQVEDARRLKALFDRRVEKISQEEFAATYFDASQGLVWQYLNGYIALNLESAIRFARGLRCKIQDFSPSLATLLEPVVTEGLVGEPAPLYSPQTKAIADMVESLDEAGKRSIQEDVKKEKRLQELSRKVTEYEQGASPRQEIGLTEGEGLKQATR